jgi:hypothetical protein
VSDQLLRWCCIDRLSWRGLPDIWNPSTHQIPRVREGGPMAAGTERVDEIGATPQDKRRGKLKNGNPSGDFSKAARCGAKTRRGIACQCPAMKNGRCRLHGGLSTGARTAEGTERIRRAVTRHCRFTAQAIAERRQFRELLRQFRQLLATF